MTEPPVSVLLPTVRPTPVIDDVAAQLRGDDELLVCCDAPADPVADVDLPAGARLVVAGEPERCAGKANALAAGTEAARHERLVWTDDDFEHPPDWLDELRTDYERQGPTTELPYFRGRDPLSLLLEPLYVVSGTLLVDVFEKVWGGAVVFERSDLEPPADAPRPDVAIDGGDAGSAADDGVGDAPDDDSVGNGAGDAAGSTADGSAAEEPAVEPTERSDHAASDGGGAEAVFLAELRRTFGDDALLSQYLDVTPVRRLRTVEPPEGVRDTVERHVRWTTGLERFAPLASAASAVLVALLAVGCLLLPLPTVGALAVGTGAVYARLGLRRWTFLLAWPALLASVPLGIYLRSRQTLTWGGRRYRWPSTFDVQVVEDEGAE